MSDADTAFQAVKGFRAVDKPQLLSVIESVLIEGVDSTGLLPAVLQSQKAEPDVPRHSAFGAYGADDAAAFLYFCQGSKILCNESM